MKTAKCSAILPHEKWHTRGLTGQRLCADKTIVAFTHDSVWFVSGVFDLNWILGFFAGDTGTVTEERGCMNTWMTPSEEKKKKRSKIRFCYSGLRQEKRKWTGTSCLVSSMTLHCIETMWRVNCSLVYKKFLKMDIKLQEPAMSLHCLLPVGLHLTLLSIK